MLSRIVLVKTVRHAVSKTLNAFILFAQYQNVIRISNMNTDFQTDNLQIAPPVNIIRELLNALAVPAVSLIPKPDVKPMEINITDERIEDCPLQSTLIVRPDTSDITACQTAKRHFDSLDLKLTSTQALKQVYAMLQIENKRRYQHTTRQRKNDRTVHSQKQRGAS